MSNYTEDVHYCVTHQLPSTLDGMKVFGQKYPLCQYGNGTWFRHGGENVVVQATEVAGRVTCGLCIAILGASDAKC